MCAYQKERRYVYWIVVKMWLKCHSLHYSELQRGGRLKQIDDISKTNWLFHVFCCSVQWLETRPSRPQCPVCKAGISRDKVIPLYGRGSSSQEDPRCALYPAYCACGCVMVWPCPCEWLFVLDSRLKTPPRPQGQRTEPESRGGVSLFVFVTLTP